MKVNKYLKYNIIILLICAVFSNIFCVKLSAEDTIKYETNFSAVDTYVENELKVSHIPGASIGIVQGDAILYENGYGSAGNGKNVTPQTLFEIGSVSKSFTALAVMQLSEKGKIDIDSSVEQYLPWFKAYYNNQPASITVRQLLNQNSGIPTFFDNDVDAEISIEQVVKEHLNNAVLKNTPGSEFLYSNANYIILGEIVQAVSGESYEEYIQNNIFKPLEMNHSYLSKEEAQKNDLADGYRQWFSFPVKADLPYFKGNIPCGHIISCAEDMCHYLSIFINEGKYKDKSIISPQGIKELTDSAVKTGIPIGTDAEEAYYGMGWGINYKNGSVNTIEHTGETSNYHAHALINPVEKTAVIELDNLGGYITDTSLAPCILSMITNNAHPYKSQSLSEIYMIMNLGHTVIIFLLLISCLRLRSFKERIQKSRLRFRFNLIFTILMNLALPLIILIMGPVLLGGTTWNSIMIFSPDISLVLFSASIVLLVQAIIKIRIFIKVMKIKSLPHKIINNCK